MTVELIAVGKTDSQHVEALVEMYMRRINRYVKFAVTTIPDVRQGAKQAVVSQMRREGEALLRLLTAEDYVVLLDDKGQQFTSMELASWLQKRMNGSPRRLCFIIGGPYGFSPQVYERADAELSLSRMTFSHQIVRAIFAEQLYRAFTILHNEPYHHE